MKTKTTLFTICLVVLSCNAMAQPTNIEGCEECHPEITENFATSLHYTGVGMMEEYESGAAGHFHIDMDEYYQKWNCSKCHVSTCTQCHFGYQNSSAWGHVEQVEITIQTCDPCHKKKQTATFVGDMPGHKKKAPSADIHYEAGMTCIDCHVADELHGTGVTYTTQLEAVSVQCTDCHDNAGKVVKGMNVSQYSVETRSHEIHDGKLACISCHSSWVLSCNGCHLDTRKGTKPVFDEFYLGRDKDGLVTTFLKMDAHFKNETHTGYGEWYGHVATDEPKNCTFCHEDEDVLLAGCEGQMIGEGGSLLSQETIDRVLAVDLSEEERSVLGRLVDWLRTL